MYNTVTELLKKLISIESTNPGLYESGIFSFLKDFFYDIKSECEGKTITIKTEEVLPGRSNIMAVIEGDPRESELVFMCHMDTVPLGNNWNVLPLEGVIKNGLLYGRGSCDMKGGMACALMAFLHASKNKNLKRTIKFIGTVDEEGFMQGSEKAVASGWINDKSLIMDTEPTSLDIQGAHKGRIWVLLKIKGIPAHASTPWNGADAIYAMSEALCHIRKQIEELREHPLMGKSTTAFGKIEGGKQPYVVSDSCSTYIDIRLVPPYSEKDVRNIVELSIKKAELMVPGAKGSYEITGSRPAIDFEASYLLPSMLLKAYKEVCYKEPSFTVFNGYTDTAVVAGMTGNRNCLSFGPGSLSQAHKPDEYVSVEELVTCEKVLKRLVEL